MTHPASTKPMPMVGQLFLPRTCGGCEYAEPTQDLSVVVCHGVPPTPCVVGAQQDALGRAHFNLEMMVPRVPRALKGCALWSRRLTELN